MVCYKYFISQYKLLVWYFVIPSWKYFICSSVFTYNSILKTHWQTDPFQIKYNANKTSRNLLIIQLNIILNIAYNLVLDCMCVCSFTTVLSITMNQISNYINRAICLVYFIGKYSRTKIACFNFQVKMAVTEWENVYHKKCLTARKCFFLSHLRISSTRLQQCKLALMLKCTNYVENSINKLCLTGLLYT